MDLCKKCGECCHKHYYDNGKIIKTDVRCKHLTDKNLCDVYDNRPDWCFTSDKMIELNLLPHNCGYQRR